MWVQLRFSSECKAFKSPFSFSRFNYDEELEFAFPVWNQNFSTWSQKFVFATKTWNRVKNKPIAYYFVYILLTFTKFKCAWNGIVNDSYDTNITINNPFYFWLVHCNETMLFTSFSASHFKFRAAIFLISEMITEWLFCHRTNRIWSCAINGEMRRLEEFMRFYLFFVFSPFHMRMNVFLCLITQTASLPNHDKWFGYR